MYVHSAFKADDATAIAFVKARGFGTLIAIDGHRPVASHLPLLVDHSAPTPRIACHVARANPLHAVIAKAPEVLITVTGPDAYVSPDWYVSADQVPTWVYVSVHLTGRARLLAAEETLAHVDGLSAEFEARLLPKKPWTSAKMTPAKREAMLRAIVPIEVTVERIEASWKLSQHKSAADQDGMLAGLEGTGEPAALAITQIARRRRAVQTPKGGSP